MVVKRYRWNPLQNKYELIREIDGIDPDLCYAEMLTDLPVESPAIKYEIGNGTGNNFIMTYSWFSENPNLFDIATS